jgi:RNA polymerase sigma-70 factor, ECF subfamily
MDQDEYLASLCRRIRSSDRAAFAAVFAALRPELLRYVGATIRDGVAAHDLVQDVFIGLWERRERLDPAQSLRTLLFRMARNRSLNHLRFVRVRRSGPLNEDPLVVMSAPDLDAQALAHRLREWIDELPERQCEAIELTRFSSLSHREAAEVMDISPRTLNNHLVRALATLNQRLERFRAATATDDDARRITAT